MSHETSASTPGTDPEAFAGAVIRLLEEYLSRRGQEIFEVRPGHPTIIKPDTDVIQANQSFTVKVRSNRPMVPHRVTVTHIDSGSTPFPSTQITSWAGNEGSITVNGLPGGMPGGAGIDYVISCYAEGGRIHEIVVTAKV